jgi:hypothetical protein
MRRIIVFVVVAALVTLVMAVPAFAREEEYAANEELGPMLFEVSAGDDEICAYQQGLIVEAGDTRIVVDYEEGVEIDME